MSKKSKITSEQIESSLKRFSQELVNSTTTQPEEVPPGWFTVAELAEEIGKSHCTTSERVRRMLKRGQVERKDFTIKLDQRIRPVPHYRLLKK